VRKNRIKERETAIENQSREHLRHGNNCSALTICLLHRITSSQPWVNILSLQNFLCCIVDGWVDHWCTEVSWVWRMPNRNAAALLHNNNIRNNQLLYHQGSRVFQGPEYTTIYDAPSCYTEVPKYNSALSYITREPEYYTEAPKYYITKAPEFYTSMYAAPAYYTESPNYYNTEVRISDTARSAVAYLSPTAFHIV
jgi:hypothetical protein